MLLPSTETLLSHPAHSAVPQSQRIVLNWKKRRPALQTLSPWRVGTEHKAGEIEEKEHFLVLCYMAREWSSTGKRNVIAFHSRTIKRRGQPGGRKELTTWFSQSFFLYVQACVCLPGYDVFACGQDTRGHAVWGKYYGPIISTQTHQCTQSLGQAAQSAACRQHSTH